MTVFSLFNYHSIDTIRSKMLLPSFDRHFCVRASASERIDDDGRARRGGEEMALGESRRSKRQAGAEEGRQKGKRRRERERETKEAAKKRAQEEAVTRSRVGRTTSSSLPLSRPSPLAASPLSITRGPRSRPFFHQYPTFLSLSTPEDLQGHSEPLEPARPDRPTTSRSLRRRSAIDVFVGLPTPHVSHSNLSTGARYLGAIRESLDSTTCVPSSSLSSLVPRRLQVPSTSWLPSLTLPTRATLPLCVHELPKASTLTPRMSTAAQL